MNKIIIASRGIHIIEYIYPIIKKLSEKNRVYLVLKTNEYSLSGERYSFNDNKIYKTINKKKIELYKFPNNVQIIKSPEINKISIVYFLKLYLRKLRLVCQKYTKNFKDFFFENDCTELGFFSKFFFFFYKKIDIKNQNYILFIFKKIENFLPPSKKHLNFIREINPNYVFVSPVNFQNRSFFLSPEIEFIKAAKQCNIQCGVYQLSWDNFNARGIIDFEPNQIFYWHDYSKIILRNLHDITNASLIKSGPMYFERLYNLKKMNKNKKETRNYILFFGSTDKIIDFKDEIIFINRLLNEEYIIKNKIMIYFKPHPSSNIDRTLLDIDNNLLKIIKEGFAITNDEMLYYQSLIDNALFVCGVNTSAMFEAHVLGRKTICINFLSKLTLPTHLKYIFEQNIFIVSNSYKQFIEILTQIKNNKINTFNDINFEEMLPSEIINNKIENSI